MCGIAGFWGGSGGADRAAHAALAAMTGAIRHRGPDAGGSFVDREAQLALGHRRLSILDLSEAGAQPMRSAGGRFLIVFNGEIYNHRDVRRRLEEEARAPRWRGHSDTETLLAAVEAWGLHQALERATGMFALALWDRSARTLSLARDRLGEKPLYFGTAGGALCFGSELKALMAFPPFQRELDPAAVSEFLRYGYVPEPRSIFAGIRKVPPGATLTFRHPLDQPAPARFWQLRQVIGAGKAAGLSEDHEALSERVERCLEEVVASQMLSDVPLGCFLSGGIDSSLVAALMQRASRRRVRSFSIGFETPHLNEADHARRVAAHLGTEHTEFMVTERDALDLVAELPAIYDEPFADSSQIPTTLLARLARRDVTVALTGDGGDEVFGGYNRHIWVPALWRRLRRMPAPARRALGRSLSVTGSALGGARGPLRRGGTALGLPLTTFDKLGQIGGALARADDYGGFYRGVASLMADPAAMLRWQPEHGEDALAGEDWGLDLAEWTMAMDARSYLPGDILVKVDRAAMSASLETRCPLLDRRIVELAWQLPLGSKIQGRTGKRILRDILHRHVPAALIDRPKQGFSVPLERWLRGELRPWAEEHLSLARLDRSGIFDARTVRRLWDDHLGGKGPPAPAIWNVLMLQAWLAEYRPAAPAAPGEAAVAPLVDAPAPPRTARGGGAGGRI